VKSLGFAVDQIRAVLALGVQRNFPKFHRHLLKYANLTVSLGGEERHAEAQKSKLRGSALDNEEA